MMFAGEEAIAIHHTVGGDFRLNPVRAVHGPTDHTGGRAGTEAGSDGSIGGDPAFGYLAHHGEDLFKKRFVFFAGGPDLLHDEHKS
jgi:hypothetical protein